MFRQQTLALLVSSIAFTGTSQAAIFAITPTLTGAFEPGVFNPVPNFDPATYDGPPVVLQVDFRLQYQGPEGTFGAIVFDVESQNLTLNPDVGGWQPNNPFVDSGDWKPHPPPFANNSDFGIPNDLKYITAGIASGIPTTTFDPRLKIGQGAQVGGIDLDWLGSLYLDWNPGTSAEVSVTLREAGYRRPSDGLLFVDPNPTLVGNTLRIGPPTAPIPEPTTVIFACLAGLLGAGITRVRRADTRP